MNKNNLQENLSQEDLRIAADIAANIGVFDALPFYNVKGFIAVNNGLKFNIPTNQYKSNRCIVKQNEELDYSMHLTSEYFDNRKQQIVVNIKKEFVGLDINKVVSVIYGDLIKL